jgi:spermidine synthase
MVPRGAGASLRAKIWCTMATKSLRFALFILATSCLSILLPSIGAYAQAEKLLESKESLYNNIYVYQRGDIVAMTFGFNKTIYTESEYNTKDDRDLPVAYTRFMTAGLMYAKKLESVVEIGFGGGRTSWYLHRFLPDVPVMSVELDPEVIDLAHKYFGIKAEPNFKVVNQDGRIFLANAPQKFDVILIDAYRGPFVPFHLLTKEFYEIVKAHLSEGGVVMQNVEPSTMLFDSAVKTINSVFPEVDFYLAEGNVVTVAYEGARTPEQLATLAKARDQQFGLRYKLTDMLAQRRRLSGETATIDASAKVLTDDFAPVEALKAIDSHNRKWQQAK